MDAWPDTDQVIARFRKWMEETKAEAAEVDDQPEPAADVAEEPLVELFPLVEQLTALRHETKLLTKAARGVEERNEATLLSMQAAIEQFRAVEAKEAAAAESAARPLVETLIELDESLVRSREAIDTARQRFLAEVSRELQALREQLDDLYRAQPWWRRLLCRPWHRAARDLLAERLLDKQRKIYDSLLEGFDLLLNRLRRALNEHSILRMACVGRQVDPNAMTVLEVVSDPSRPTGHVVEEVRPGYYWKGKVFRFAEVKAVGQK